VAETLSIAGSFLAILVGSELFTNGIEWLGKKLSFSEAAVGSLLAAIGTALPETFVPLVALVGGGGSIEARKAVGVGAIVGAPLMISTVTLLVASCASLVYRQRRGRVELRVPAADVRRDLGFFFVTFAAVTGLGMVHSSRPARVAMAVAVIGIYALFTVQLLKTERRLEESVEGQLYLARLISEKRAEPPFWATIVQVSLGIATILVGAHEFVNQLVAVSSRAGASPGLLSLILSPLATELPEAYNAVLWIRQSKDNLALANLTGALVFQACIPVTLGLLLTPWHLDLAETLGSAIALVAVALLFYNVRHNRLGMPAMLASGVGYVIFLAALYAADIF
jgi:cation:H+ antiporter